MIPWTQWSGPRGQTCALQIMRLTTNMVCLHAISMSQSMGAYSVTSATDPSEIATNIVMSHMDFAGHIMM